MNWKKFFYPTKSKIILFVALAFLMNLVEGPFGHLEVETTQGGYSIYNYGFPFISYTTHSPAFLPLSELNWTGVLANSIIAYIFVSFAISLSQQS